MSFEGKTITCKAAVAWGAKEPLSIEDIQVAPPKAHEVRVKVDWSAVCHTDAYTLSGVDPEGAFPIVLGHEGAGIVESIGEGVINVRPGDHVILLYTPECKECKFCRSGKTNLCSKIRETQGRGLMPDGTSRFSCRDKTLLHYMGCSSFSQYTVVADISLVAISHSAPLRSICLLGCGVTTGFGAVTHSAKVESGSTVAVVGCGCVGLAAMQGAVAAGASRIIAIDINADKEVYAKKFGATDFIDSSKVKDLVQYVIDVTDGGVDYAFDCTGNVTVMQQELQFCHKGWGKLCVIGVAAAGKTLDFRPFLVVTGRQVLGSAFGGVKGRSELPNFVDEYMQGHFKVDEYITNEEPLKNINKAFDHMHEGKCIRCVVDMNKP
ncbi:S-(hydroxymethyl)glutathione dehydrogenase [Schizosaccharomyces pombe]|uniref:Probable S-(hydroxymethyl)glutathione dehydrogenase 1 n=1 Tax=Schizosaccharomyces pombe (strain 972 / ATCC 24843) TaxID=284812 RepID=FADH1_SCHPO|nr:putative glutathione-dependent formaldehyde dehydrogenase [Schizosaccharomyces pombe]P78870.2 RecName: Full=Probable S-(hydroxymethyl)glutathione dehydrogenase 1; AltName: Full=Glutathione-dependent formaldehyde dehydrogenase 1; Short=FALDH 1; Short=FDH 1; Short=FLD 1; Short=GSH-FDH 1 [Schizosaccharomyces pombe 972h-]CAB51339.1 glutathione-dependent formaldehyde dehydrogenase (predicted) [Schizosaccharomyces pombe]|eukprot:NP_596821.1 putative glutathione-dependent formaldehyde dehydrogenase [Schizosaccharomyces pombe]